MQKFTPKLSIGWSVSYFFVSIARANFICRYSRTSRYISFTWVSKRGHLRCANGALAPPCPPYDTPKKHSMNLQASQVLKIGMSAKYLIRTIGPLPYWCIFIVTSPQEINKTMQSNYVRMLQTSKTKFDSAGNFFAGIVESLYIYRLPESRRGGHLRCANGTLAPPAHQMKFGKWLFGFTC